MIVSRWRKSSHSSSQGGACVEWRKSSRSSSQGGACVEARTPTSGLFQVRDSKLGNDSPILGIDRGEFAGIVTAMKAGRLHG
ncbi:hypothetical protein STSO111631_22800 [Stackebrandtia soli]